MSELILKMEPVLSKWGECGIGIMMKVWLRP